MAGITFTLTNKTEFNISCKVRTGFGKIDTVNFPHQSCTKDVFTSEPQMTSNSFVLEVKDKDGKTIKKTMFFHFQGELESTNYEADLKYNVFSKDGSPDRLVLKEEGKSGQKVVLRDLKKLLGILRKEAFYQGFYVTVRDQVDYLQGKEIANSYFNWFPGAVAFPETADQVVQCMQFCQKHQVPVRLRSGGHQHEGMSSANNVLMIRMSKMNKIQYADAQKMSAWIGVGKQLENVYYELELEKRYLPGGGCQSVNVGGLTLGGGWGGGTRMYGLTCDQVEEAEVVLADNTIVWASNDSHPELFKALRGGGGGNFGIVTRFKFRLQELKKIATSSVRFKRKYALQVIQVWMDFLAGRIEKLKNEKIIVTLIHHVDYDKARADSENIVAFIRCFGTKDELKKWRADFSEEIGNRIGGQGRFEDFAEGETVGFDFTDPEMVMPVSLQAHDKALYEALNPSLPPVGAYNAPFWYAANLKPPASTCDAPHPHKVSSAFQKKGAGQTEDYALAEQMVEYLDGKVGEEFERVNAFAVFHALGGAAAKEPAGGSGFAFRDRNYLLQFETWWAQPNDEQGQVFIDWVTNFRKKVWENVEGAFINFPDYNLVENPAENRLELLKFYYGEKLDELRKIKKQYDPKNTFDFEMGILPAD